KDPVKYNVYRCTEKQTACTSPNQFTTIVSDLPDTTLQYQDATVYPDTTYTYCITAKDPGGNESVILNYGNCIECTPSIKPKPPLNPDATFINADECDMTIKIWWTKSADDTGNGMGYNIYRCTGKTADTCDTTAAGKVNTTGYIASAKTDSDPYLATNEPKGIWYYGITYVNADEIESDLAVTSNTILIQYPEDACYPCDPVECPFAISLTSPINQINWDDTSCGGFCKSPKANVKIELVDDTGTIIRSIITNSDGTTEMRMFETDILTGKTYTIRVNIPLSAAAGMPCERSEYLASGNCVINLKKGITGEEIQASRYDDPITVSGIDIPKSGGGRKEIGNADCDGEIGYNDLKELKKNYRKNLSDGADPWADFNGDGTVGFDDLKILVMNYRMIVYGSETIDKTDPYFCKP
ncbi:MAG: hypothetical protein AB1546_14865, partial [bacterium]